MGKNFFPSDDVVDVDGVDVIIIKKKKMHFVLSRCVFSLKTLRACFAQR